MAKWYYYNENGERVGPIRGRELIRFVQKETITQETFIEDETGRIDLAKNVKGLKFPETTQSQPTPPLEPNPFTDAPPTEPNPFAIPEPKAEPHSADVPAAKGNWIVYLVAFVGFAAVSLVAGTVWNALNRESAPPKEPRQPPGLNEVWNILNDEPSKIKEAEIFVRSMRGPLDQYLIQFGSYPSTAEGLDALLNPPDGGKPLVEQSAIKADPWGNPYQYQFPGQRVVYDLWSFGPDGIPDSGDEIGNW